MTKAELEWMSDIVQLGCLICRREGRGWTPAEVHHMLSGGRRLGHLFTIPLCRQHHRSGRDDCVLTSRDQNQRRFETRYGTESDMLEEVRGLVERMRNPPIRRAGWDPRLDTTAWGTPLKPGR